MCREVPPLALRPTKGWDGGQTLEDVGFKKKVPDIRPVMCGVAELRVGGKKGRNGGLRDTYPESWCQMARIASQQGGLRKGNVTACSKYLCGEDLIAKWGVFIGGGETV